MLVCDDEQKTAAFKSNAICRYLCSVSGQMLYKASKEVLNWAKIDGFMDSFNQLDVAAGGCIQSSGLERREDAYDEANEEDRRRCHSFLMSLEALKTMIEERHVFSPREALRWRISWVLRVAKICFCLD